MNPEYLLFRVSLQGCILKLCHFSQSLPLPVFIRSLCIKASSSDTEFAWCIVGRREKARVISPEEEAFAKEG